jgi:hypothetical protein
MVQEISPADTSSEKDKSTGSSPNSLPRRLIAEETRDAKIAIRFPKWTLQYSILMALGCFVLYRQAATVSSSSTVGAETVKSRLHGNEERGVLGSFVMPERSDLRYPEYANMTAAEKVANEYVVRNITDYDPLANCSVTSQVRIIQMSSQQWMMQSIDTNGNNKTMGGDEFYVTYTDNHPPQKGNHTAAALIQDLENGLYALTFKTTPMDPNPGNLTGVGTLSVRFQYSCNIGHAHQPVKSTWKIGGGTLLHHTKSNVTQPPIQTFRPPSGVDLSSFDLVVSFGDSMMQTFVRSRTGKMKYHRGKTVWQTNVLMDLSSDTFSRMLKKLKDWHGRQHLLNSTNNVALLLGSSAWDITRPAKPHPDFNDHLDTCRRFVLKVQDLYPNATVIWKAPAAVVRTDDFLFFRCENVIE